MFKNLPHKYHILRNILYTFASGLVFFIGIILYGIILNLREMSLNEALAEKGLSRISNPSIIVDRKKYSLYLYSDEVLVKKYKAAFGKNSSNVKTSWDDHVTPIGVYEICKIDTISEYHKFLQINYPNQRDAAEALKKGYITAEEFSRVIDSINSNDQQCTSTKIGARIGIHGIGEYDFVFKNLPFVFNWTNGSIAVSNDDIDELLSVVKKGTKIEIRY